MVKVVNPLNDPKKKKQTDSTTDFFLQFVKEEKSEKEKTEAKKGEREQTYTKTVEKVSTAITTLISC